ncbi:hypothetical protein C2E23DRAFT_818091 [Lenzites betulinus]|nr:hypothetical protein C2E23DRAFT_818091 [Lenzites betulinus]
MKVNVHDTVHICTDQPSVALFEDSQCRLTPPSPEPYRTSLAPPPRKAVSQLCTVPSPPARTLTCVDSGVRCAAAPNHFHPSTRNVPRSSEAPICLLQYRLPQAAAWLLASRANRSKLPLRMGLHKMLRSRARSEPARSLCPTHNVLPRHQAQTSRLPTASAPRLRAPTTIRGRRSSTRSSAH